MITFWLTLFLYLLLLWLALMGLIVVGNLCVDLADKVRVLFQKAGLDIVTQSRAESQANIDHQIQQVKLLRLYDVTEHEIEMLKLDRRQRRVAISKQMQEVIE